MKNTKLNAAVSKFHNDEAGLEALQVVMILAVAAVALIAVKSRWDDVRDWFHNVMQEGTGDNWASE